MHRAALHLVAISLALAPSASPAAEGRRMTVEDLLAVPRIGDVQIAPDGRNVAFTLSRADLDTNRVTAHIWVAPAGGGEPWQLTRGEKGEGSPAWSPDSRRVAFTSSRGGKSGLWVIPLEGGEAKEIASRSAGVGAPLWSPDGKQLAFTGPVDPREGDEPDVPAEIFDELFYRHWSEWRRGRREHIFVVPAEGGEPRDVTPGDFDVAGGAAGFSFSPDGTAIAFSRGPIDPATGSAAGVEAWSTNADVFVAPIAGGPFVPVSAGNPGWDGSPVWSPDGRRLAFRSQARDGYEADRFRLAIAEPAAGKVTFDVAPSLDRWVERIFWSPAGDSVIASGEEAGTMALWRIPIEGLVASGPPRRILSGIQFSPSSMPAAGGLLAGTIQSLTRPADVAILDLSRGEQPSPRAVTRFGAEAVAGLELPSVESIRYPSAGGREIQAWLLKPPGYAPGLPRPFLVFIHGGPQGAWDDVFHFRWNVALYASRGYVVLLPNVTGSTGFGQEFVEAVSGDWGGAAYEDVLRGADWAIERGLADPARMGALGGSYGGYMVNWILGHTDRFRALVSHAGVYNLESMYGTTEELWFPEWELGGPPWKGGGSYEKFSPHRFADRFRTPTLVIHGALDFRVPVSEGMQLFTALRRRGIEARFLHYPDEGHWIAKPRNARLWNRTVIDWLARFLSPDGR